ncbi:hypothetical protein [Herbidospora cretacea]|nr:hypothetical protein [Herbidospora cretacea]
MKADLTSDDRVSRRAPSGGSPCTARPGSGAAVARIEDRAAPA